MAAQPSAGRRPPLPARVLSGQEERIFAVLPGNVIANLRRPRSENALLWNRMYPRAQPSLSLASLLELTPLWGTNIPEPPQDELVPYFWGYAVDGERLSGLDEVLRDVDGPGPNTEVDLFLKGSRHLVAVEVKHLSNAGTCSRYQSCRCPEMHPHAASENHCRYWQSPFQFDTWLQVGARPEIDAVRPVCDRHYQLGRTLLVGAELARRQGCIFHLWMIVPQTRWNALELEWLDFSERVRDDQLWRRLRVLSWEALEALPAA